MASASAEVGLAPDLQPAGSDNGGAFRGVLGDCEKDHGLYHGFVPQGEAYYCNTAEAELAWKAKYYPAEELCDWAFGELPPRPRIGIDGKPIWGPPGPEYQESPGSAPGTTGPTTTFPIYGCAASGSAILGGSTPGRLSYQAQCKKGLLPMCLHRFTKQSLNWPTSMAIYKINEKTGPFVKAWRAIYHRPNIAFGNREKYYAGWVRKVVRCADIPEKLLKIKGGMVSAQNFAHPWEFESSLEFATRTWRGMQSLLTADNLTASFYSPADWAPEPIEQVMVPNVSVSVASGKVHVAVSGKDGKWFGIGFGAAKMADHPPAIVVDGDGKVLEWTLATYSYGSPLESQFEEVSHSVVSGVRTVVLTRSARGSGPDRFSFPNAGQQMKYIWAVGIGAVYSTHERSGPGETTVIASSSAPWADILV